MTITEEVRAAAESALENSEGLFLVSAEMKNSGELVVEIDSDLGTITLEEIVGLTRELRAAIGDERLGAYDLTVTSAGLTSPVRMPRQYRKLLGKNLAVLLKTGVKEHGILRCADDETLSLEVVRKVKVEGKKKKKEEAQTLQIPYTEVKSAVYDLKI